MDTPWRMFSQVITLCGQPHNQHSVIHLSYTSAERNPVSRMSLWFNRLKQADDFSFFFFFFLLLHNLDETSLMNCRTKTADSAPRLQCYNIDTHQEIKYAHLHFQFICTTEFERLWFLFLVLVYSRKAYRFVHTHPCVYFKCIYTYEQTDFWLTFAS